MYLYIFIIYIYILIIYVIKHFYAIYLSNNKLIIYICLIGLVMY